MLHKVQYNDPKDKPICNINVEDHWFESERLIIKFEFNGQIGYTLGCYRVYPNLKEGEFKLDNYIHPNWSDCVTGWAYV